LTERFPAAKAASTGGNGSSYDTANCFTNRRTACPPNRPRHHALTVVIPRVRFRNREGAKCLSLLYLLHSASWRADLVASETSQAYSWSLCHLPCGMALASRSV